MFNKVFLIGRLGQDPEMRYTPSGTAVTSFTLATNRKFKDKDGNLQEETTWHDIVCWGKNAEFVAEYVHKGRLVFIEGELRRETWDDRNGQKRVSVKINAKNVQPLEWGDKGSNPSSGGGGGSRKPAPQEPPPSDFGETEDDVPF